METVKLANGVEMPVLGYGVYQVSPSECEARPGGKPLLLALRSRHGEVADKARTLRPAVLTYLSEGECLELPDGRRDFSKNRIEFL